MCDGLKGENLGKKARERREALIKRIKDVKQGYVHLVVCHTASCHSMLGFSCRMSALTSVYLVPNRFPQDFKDKSECWFFRSNSAGLCYM